MIYDSSPFFFESWTHPRNWHSYYHQHYAPRRRLNTRNTLFSSDWESTRGDWVQNDSERSHHYRLKPRIIPIQVERADANTRATEVYYELSDNEDDSCVEILTPQEVELDFNNSASMNNRKRRKNVTQQSSKFLLERENTSKSPDEAICQDVDLQQANYAEGSRRRNIDSNNKAFSISFAQDHKKQSSEDKETERSDDVYVCDELSCSSTDLKYKLEENEKEINETPSYTIYSYLSELLMQSGRQIDYIRGDGNCFFRALSKVIYGTESCHKHIREAVVDVMKKYPKKFEAYLDLNEGGIKNHIQEMRQLGTWATQTEIYAAATLLQRDIYVLSPDPSGDNYRWLLFTPVFQYSGDISYHPCFVTLCHTNGNHYDRVATIEGKCNCDIDPPELSGINASVDLESEIV